MIESKDYRFKFELVGNSDSSTTVKKGNSKLGDGEIGTGSGGYVNAIVNATMRLVENDTKVLFSIAYDVKEDNYGKKSGDDWLRMTKDFYFDVSAFTQLASASRIQGNKRITKTIKKITLNSLEKQVLQTASYKAVISAGNERHKELQPSWTGAEKSWLPGKEIYIKIDGKGKELEKEGNLSIRGYVYFTISLLIDEKTEVIYQEEPDTPKLDYGVGKAFETLPAVMDATLGCGYDIAGDSPQISSCKYRVLDLDRLNKYKHIVARDYNKSENQMYEGESINEYTEDINEKYGISASFGIGGFTFSNETNWSFSKSSSKKSTNKYKKYDFKTIYHTYEIDEYRRPEKLLFFLTEKFKKHLNELNPEEFVKYYGTHVVLGMKVGGRLTYNSRFQESILSGSSASSVTTNTKIGHTEGGTPSAGNADVNTALNNLYTKMSNPNLTPEQLSELAKAASSLQGVHTNTKTGGNAGGWNVNVGGTTSNTETITFSNTDRTTEITCYSVGGDPAMAGSFLMDQTKYDKWAETVKNNQVFMDFIPGSVIPIYEFIPKSRRGENYKLTREMVKEAVESHLLDKRLQNAEPANGEQKLEFNTLGKLNSKKKQEDEEVDSENDKLTGWEAYFQLVNFGDGFAGCIINYKVYEGGLNAGRTILENSQEIKLSKGKYAQMVIMNDEPTFHMQGTIRGKRHDWIDVTEKFQDCEFIDTYGDNVEIKIDGSGNDLGNIGIRGTLKIKYKAM
jgi:hypothetical protein